MSHVETTTEPGWRPDPSGRFDWRYWDGGWTNRVANSSPRENRADARVTPPPLPGPAPVTSRTASPPSPAPQGPAAPPPPSAAPAAAPPTPMVPVSTGDGPPAVPVEPFGAPTAAPTSAVEPKRPARGIWARLVAFFQSFADEPESYQSPHTAVDIPPDPRGGRVLRRAPANYGRAGIVALAGCGIAGGAYLPWLSGTIGAIGFHRTGYDMGHGLGYGLGAIALAIAALLAVHMRPLRYATLGLALVLAGFVAHDLVKTYDVMQSMNRAVTVDANIGTGLWIMVVSAGIAMIAATRLSEDAKIV